MERVTGPVNGYYIVTYACPVGEHGDMYVGYGRVCAAKPASFWEATAVAEVVENYPVRTSDAAHWGAFFDAVRRVPVQERLGVRHELVTQ